MTDLDHPLTSPTLDEVASATAAADLMRRAADRLDAWANGTSAPPSDDRLATIGRAVATQLRSDADDAEQIGPDPHATATARAILGEGS